MQEFMRRYCRCMITFERTKIEGKDSTWSAVDSKLNQV
jgi:hypothetical protein